MAAASPVATTPISTPGADEIRASSYVGFDSITSQIEHKLLKRGFQFNVIVVGTCSRPRWRPSPAPAVC